MHNAIYVVGRDLVFNRGWSGWEEKHKLIIDLIKCNNLAIVVWCGFKHFRSMVDHMQLHVDSM